MNSKHGDLVGVQSLVGEEPAASWLAYSDSLSTTHNCQLSLLQLLKSLQVVPCLPSTCLLLGYTSSVAEPSLWPVHVFPLNARPKYSNPVQPKSA